MYMSMLQKFILSLNNVLVNKRQCPKKLVREGEARIGASLESNLFRIDRLSSSERTWRQPLMLASEVLRSSL